MAYGYKEWLAHEGHDNNDSPVSPRIGALQMVLAIVDNLQYPRPGWGVVEPTVLKDTIRKLVSTDNQGNAEWDGALQEALAMFEQEKFLVLCGSKIDPKTVVNKIKKLLPKDAAPAEKAAEPEAEA